MAQNRRSPAKEKAKTKKPAKGLLRDTLEVIIPAVLIFLVVKTFFFESRVVPTPSMVPTIEMGERFLENKVVYWFRPPRRGEIVVFHPPAAAIPPGYKRDDFVKRLIGLPGETVTIRAGLVYLRKAGETKDTLLPEPYVPQDRMDYLDFGPFKLLKDEYFLLGDNRRQSRDSRYWGTVSRKAIDGKAFWRFWPPNRISILK